MNWKTESDVELWLYKLSDNQIPVYATPGTLDDGQVCWRVCPAIHDDMESVKLIARFFREKAISSFRGFWMIGNEDFHFIGRPLRG
jgi:hypothetical protein